MFKCLKNLTLLKDLHVDNLVVKGSCLFSFKFSPEDMFTDLGERGRNIESLPSVCPLTGDRTSNLLVHRMVLQLTEPLGQGKGSCVFVALTVFRLSFAREVVVSILTKEGAETVM